MLGVLRGVVVGVRSPDFGEVSDIVTSYEGFHRTRECELLWGR